jgi:hypothetical protein
MDGEGGARGAKGGVCAPHCLETRGTCHVTAATSADRANCSAYAPTPQLRPPSSRRISRNFFHFRSEPHGIRFISMAASRADSGAASNHPVSANWKNHSLAAANRTLTNNDKEPNPAKARSREEQLCSRLRVRQTRCASEEVRDSIGRINDERCEMKDKSSRNRSVVPLPRR